MRTLTLAALFALAAVPVSAQQADQQHNKSATQQMEKQSRELQVQDENNKQANQNQRFSAMSKQKLKSALEEAGFTQINIVDATYVVRAKTEDGDNVIMYIDPPAVGQQTGASGDKLPDGSFKTDSIRRADKSESGNK